MQDHYSSKLFHLDFDFDFNFNLHVAVLEQAFARWKLKEKEMIPVSF